MGTSSRPRKNPFKGQGLVPGLTLHLEFTLGERQEALVTQVEQVDESELTVLVPIQRLQKRPLPAGHAVYVTYVHRKVQFSFVSTVNGHSPDGEYDILEAPGTIRSTERRSAFRLTTTLRPRSLYRLVIDRDNLANEASLGEIEGTLVDIGEGGVCLNTRITAFVGERIGIQVDLPQVGTMTARLRVVAIEEPLDGRRNRRIHCSFTDLGRPDRERIAQYLMRRQLEMRRRGQL